MRVIAGKIRGAKLLSPSSFETRPTTDRIKETLFNIIHNDLTDCVFVDLFSGTGSIGIEAISRGAKFSYFIDNSKEAISVINSNIGHTKIEEFSQVYHLDFESALEKIKENDVKADFIFIDPPYNKEIEKQAILKIIELSLLNIDGIIIAEVDKNTVENQFETLELYRVKEFKTTKFLFYRSI